MNGQAAGASSSSAFAARLYRLVSRISGPLGGSRFRSLPLRARIAIFGAAIVTVTVVLFAVIVYLLVQNNLDRQQDDALRARSAQIFGFGPLPLDRQFLPPVDLNTSSEPFLEVLSTTGSPLYSTGKLNGQDPGIPDSLLEQVTPSVGQIATLEPESGPSIRVLVRQMFRRDLTGYLVLGQSRVDIDRELAGLRLFLVGGALLSLLAAFGVSWLLARRALSPIEDVARTAEEIGRTQDLSRRLPAQPTHDEVGRLQASFNQMLQQLDDAYRRLQNALAAQRRFVADASHELRTPLTSIRGNIGFLLQQPEIKSGDRQAALEDIASESERMSRMVQDLLTLARADAGQHLERSAIDLRPLVVDVVRHAQPLQGARRLELEDGVPAPVIGNADALKQLCWILVDNALKHTRDDGRIAVRLVPNGSRAELSVSDDGPGIPEGELDRIFERFYQADQARAGEGTGLGLSIARWIVREHEGLIEARNNEQGGATFRVALPLASPSTANNA